MHRADARLKFLLAVGFIVAVALLPSGAFAAIGLSWLTVVVVSVAAGLGPLRTSRAALVAVPFALAALPLVATRPGEPLAAFDLGPLAITITDAGVRDFLTILLKSWVSVQGALLLAYTTPFHDLVDGLRELRVPRILIAIIGFMYRYLAVMADEAGRMMRARAARSAAPRGGGGGTLAWRASVTGRMVGSLFLRSYERSERVFAAMQARGFDGEFRYLAGPALRRRELVAFGLAALALVGFEIMAQLWLPRA
ncbi:MAG TPA: cobalt ECF transporter T component CbiQ [Candidatus Limnocylindrales bacterium]|nr:cobalt ECF transporter T component CbiQ [Candidatus Limnocylindrales bacterium]